MARRATVTAAVLALSTLASTCASRRPPLSAVTTEAGVAFVHTDREATSVAVAGSFNQWSSSSHPLVRTGTAGRWTTVVALAPGEYPYMFVVDGSRWVVPAFATEYADDGFGSTNAVVVVPAGR
jgi:1,4-alpha-glucan branching enzyme